MYMRYAGGGVGHYRVEVNDDHNIEEEDTDADEPEERNSEPILDLPLTVAQQEEILQSPHAHLPVAEDGNASEASSLDSEDEEEEEEDLDNIPEDGDGGFVDVEDDEGYAAL